MPTPSRAGHSRPNPPLAGAPAPTAGSQTGCQADSPVALPTHSPPAGRVGAPAAGPPGGAPTRRIAMHEDSAEGPAAATPNTALTAASGVAPVAGASSRPATPDLQLAAYLLARQVTGRPVSEPTQALLQRVNESKKEVLQLMPYGRGNVSTDLNATQLHGFHRLLAQRHVVGNSSSLGDPPALTHARDAALSAYAGSGNCGEFANVAAHVHARRLQEGEQLTVHKAHDLDHSWVTVEGRASPGGTVPSAVLDAWCEGPVLEPVDGRFVADARRSPLTLHRIAHADAAQASHRFDAIRADPGARTVRQFEGLTQARARENRQPTGTVYEPLSVASDTFCAATRSALNQRGHDASLTQAAATLARELAGASAEHEAAAAERILELAAHLDRAHTRALAAPGNQRRRTSPDPD